MRHILFILFVFALDASASVVSRGPDEFGLLVEFRYTGQAGAAWLWRVSSAVGRMIRFL